MRNKRSQDSASAVLAAFKMPRGRKVTQRISSVTAAFVQAIVPVINPTATQISGALRVLGIKASKLTCAYCGRTADQWDHLYALVMNKKPTGYITEINNLVPSCGACNQRKRGTNWKDFVNHPGKNFPKTFRDGFRKRLAALEKYARLRRQKIDFEKWEGDPAYSDYWKRHRAVIKALRAAQTTATHLRTKLLDTVPSKRRQ